MRKRNDARALACQAPRTGRVRKPGASDASLDPLTQAAVVGVTKALASIGRGFICLDAEFRIAHASDLGLLANWANSSRRPRKIPAAGQAWVGDLSCD